jgi:aminoglycoside phosphotransferase (APT) family kinase protein
VATLAQSVTELFDVVRLINESHGTNWSPVGRLPGGYLQGAYEIRRPDGERGVLKWHTRDLTTAQLVAAASAVEGLRARGWPTSRWLSYGALPGGDVYIVEEFLDGVLPTRIPVDGLEQLLNANRMQTDMRPVIEQDWSSYIHRVVFDGAGDLVARMRARPVTAELLARLERLIADARSLHLPTTDLVHGDFVLRNMLVSNGSLRIIDTAHVGKGTRAYDLACLLLETTVEDGWADPTVDPLRVESECLSIIGPAELRVCLVGRMLHYLVFGESWRDYDPTTLVAKCGSFIERYER